MLDQESDREIARRLKRTVEVLSVSIGPRSAHLEDTSIRKAEVYVSNRYRRMGHEPARQEYMSFPFGKVMNVANLEVEITGARDPESVILIGSHYDSLGMDFGEMGRIESPGSNDNATGVAVQLEVFRDFRYFRPEKTVRFVSFVNEEPPFFGEMSMGSNVYARRAWQNGDRIDLAISLDELGYFTNVPGTQKIPEGVIAPEMPSSGNFLAIVSNQKSLKEANRAVVFFNEGSTLPVFVATCEDREYIPQLNLNVLIPSLGMYLKVPQLAASDHGPFWSYGYKAFCITDTSFCRYPDWHEETDTIDKIDFEKLAQVTRGVSRMLKGLSR